MLLLSRGGAVVPVFNFKQVVAGAVAVCGYDEEVERNRLIESNVGLLVVAHFARFARSGMCLDGDDAGRLPVQADETESVEEPGRNLRR